MKSERRHELQHNELADWIASAAETIKPYQNIVLGVVVAVVVLMLGYTLWTRESLAQNSQAWEELSVALNGKLDQLPKIVEDYSGSEVAFTAQAILADQHLAQGCELLFKSKANGMDELSKAIVAYDAVREGARTADLQQRAAFGLAKAKESKGDDQSIKQAEKLYAEVAAKWPNGAYAAVAKQRADDLKRPATLQFYDDFRKFDPKGAFTGQPGDKPDFDLNSLSPDASPASLDTTFESKADEKKPAEDAKPADEKPAEQKPAEETKN